jgi:branched-chain amino acid transport system ATP-binding protein
MDSIIRTESLSKNFGALQAVIDVNLNVRPGVVHSIIGPNGAGKTTLFNLLTGFLKPSAGKIFLREKEITHLGPHTISKLGLGRSFQITSIFPELTVQENVRVAVQSRTKLSYRFLKSLNGLDALEDKACEVIAQVGLGDKGNLPAKHLSHGEKRILDIAIGLATNPELLLLDEPAAGLVGDEISRLTSLIRDISRDVTVVLVEHNIDVVLTISDVITVLYYGATVAEGSPQDIQKNEKVQEIYLGGYQC